MPQSKGLYWRKLDNAAKLFSAASNKKDTRVFRFYCELEEEIQGPVLQEALDKTLEQYPLFLSVMRKGLFWHYLEKSHLRPIVREEYREPCSMLYVRDKKELLFEVTYYKRRINFEVFHALTDGTGASEFIKDLVKQYLVAAHREENLPDLPLHDKKVHAVEQESDSFIKYYRSARKGRKEKEAKAYQIHRSRSELGSLQVTEALIPLEPLKSKAKEYGVSVTVFLTAAFLCALHGNMSRRQEDKPIVLMVPVNLRNYFPSQSLLNFFSWIKPGYQFGRGKDTFADVVKAVARSFRDELTAEKLERRMSEYISLEVNPVLRFAPLELKNLCITAGMRTSEKDVTAIFSNMGVISMPEIYEKYIRYFGVYTSTPKTELCICSFRDQIYLGFTSRYDSTEIKQNFFRLLQDMGIEAEVQKPDFPNAVKETYAGIKAFKIITFLCIVAVVLSISIDYLTDASFLRISLLVSGAVASAWLAWAVGFFKRYNLLKNAMWQLILITVGCTVWDVLTGWRGWSVTYVFPIADITIQVSMMILARIYYRLAKDYMIYFIMAAGYGILFPLIFLLKDMIRTPVPTVCCISFSIIMLAALIIFKGKEFKEEMQKKLHF